MLGASPALLHGKIVRGGMGTGMPYWGRSSPMIKSGRCSIPVTLQFEYP